MPKEKIKIVYEGRIFYINLNSLWKRISNAVKGHYTSKSLRYVYNLRNAA